MGDFGILKSIIQAAGNQGNKIIEYPSAKDFKIKKNKYFLLGIKNQNTPTVRNWLQDQFLVFQNGTKKYLQKTKEEENFVAVLNSHYGSEFKPLQPNLDYLFHLDGGDLIIGDEFALIGENAYRAMKDKLDLSLIHI